MTRRTFGWTAATVLLAGSVHAEMAACEVDWQRGMLTVLADGASRAQCFDALSQRTGMRVSGLENVRGTVTANFSTPSVGDFVRRIAGDLSFTLVENDADHSGDPKKLSLHFVGGDSGRDEQTALRLRSRLAVPSARVENIESGLMEVQQLPPPRSQSVASFPPSQSGTTSAQVYLEE